MKTNENAVKNKEAKAGIYGLLVFFVIFICSLLYSARVNITAFYYDSDYYWNLANIIFDNGGQSFHFLDILKFPESIRGYIFPVIIGFFRYVFHGVWGWRVFSAGLTAICFSYALPYALGAGKIHSWRSSARVFLAFAVFMWIWGDFIQYPLSDLPSAFFLIAAIALLRNIETGSKTAAKVTAGIAAGALLYAAYNTRSTFLYSGIIVLFAYIILNRKKTGTMILVTGSVCIGMIIPALPQCYINYHNMGAFSPKVNYDMIDKEVYRGIYTARYETYVGSADLFPSQKVFFRDLTGTEIAIRNKFAEEDFRLSDFFEMLRKYPLDMIGIYGRHFISLLSPVFKEVYLTNVYDVQPLRLFLSMMLWITAAYGLFELMRRKQAGWNALWTIAVCIPGLLQIFDEPELRFFLPMYILCYYFVFAVIDYKAFFVFLKSNLLWICILTILVVTLWLSIVGDTLTNLEQGRLLITENDLFKSISSE